MNITNFRKMIDISKLYYEENLSQDEIAKKLMISVPQVSRMINAAKAQGYVKTSVMDPFSESNDLTKQLMCTFNLKDARIVETRLKDVRITQTSAAQACADFLLEVAEKNDVISIAYSNIIYRLPQLLPKVHTENVSFVQPNGALFEHVKGYQFDTLRETSIKMDAFYFYFPAPAMVKDKYIKDMLHDDPIIKWVLDKANHSNMAFYSVEAPSKDSIYVKNGYFTENEMAEISRNGSVGEIFGHFINRNGEINDISLENRVLGMNIDKLRDKDYSVCVSAGDNLAEAIYATLTGKYCNVLITDTVTARKVLELHENRS